MHNAKKKTKTGKIPKPIKIKKEKTEEDRTLHSMSHYVDDRLELVKQIFGSLKPKTITNLAPDFLKKKSMDEIEELCLNELLGISTKRLLSIINATKCPTDTESSSDSDVEHQEEHISLEEISSDSEIEGASSSAGKKKTNGSDGKGNTKKHTKGTAEKEENNGQISVLELLELQARARAIRSQLALEPVTKIEVDSDAEKIDENKSSSKPTSETNSKEHKGKRRRKSSEKSKDMDKTQTIVSKVGKETVSTVIAARSTSSSKSKKKDDLSQSIKANKLKRNYRVNNTETDSGSADNDKRTRNGEPSATTKEVKKETKSRSPTPDVIPIIPEPETLCISDSSDGEPEGAGKIKTTQTEASKNSNDNGKEEQSKANAIRKPSRERKITEPEEGEICDNPVEENESNDKNESSESKDLSASTEETKNATEPVRAQKDIIEAGVSDGAGVSNETEKTGVGKEEEDNSKESLAPVAKITDTTISVTPATEKLTTAPSIEDEDDGNDDVISLEGGDLEEEMIEHLEEDTNTKSSFATSPKKSNAVGEEQDEDVISLDSSEEEEAEKTNTESWHSRYLKSSKVSKVLATSRLGKRVRDNIKKSKRSKKDSERVKNAEEKEKSNTSYASKHEDGSIEQYKELLAMRQRKK
ncbi:glutamic acid-rich protein [Ceratitis capitata]|uniref:glutamic acid-rich protein n=1 Tax=Ceratitis capitata TaxID=7213 RepID=UPI0003296BEE|nr:glutamic acid-rich protein [Ceratitis capitata]